MNTQELEAWQRLPLSVHAEAWAKDQGIRIPPRDTPEWVEMYESWIEYAFEDFGKDGT